MSVEAFVRESNLIEGITRPPTTAEVEATAKFLVLREVRVHDVEELVRVCQPGARLRIHPHMNVQVGRHLPPQGGPEIRGALAEILIDARTQATDPFQTYVAYETLHPFMDGNGRSGRALWRRSCMRTNWEQLATQQGFLRTFHYQALDASEGRG